MAASYVISCGSTVDLPREHLERRGLKYVCFRYRLNGRDYPDDFWASMSPSLFYGIIKKGALITTSQPGVEACKNCWKPILEAGQDVLYLSLSSGLSGDVNSARIAAQDLEEAYPGRRIRVIDSLCASTGYGLLTDTLADKRDAGYSLEEAAAWVEDHKLNLHHWFFSTDLSYYIRGGRVSKTAGYIGKLLNICPLLNMNSQGLLIPRDKIRTKRKVIREIVDRMAAHADNADHYSGKCFVCHSDSPEEAQAVASAVECRFPDLNGKVQIFNVGVIIGAHTGPGTVALFFWGDRRTD